MADLETDDGFAYRLTIDALRAEVERLQIALAKQTEQNQYPCSPHCAGYLREMVAQAEIKRLKTQLAIQFGMQPGGDLAKAAQARIERLEAEVKALKGSRTFL